MKCQCPCLVRPPPADSDAFDLHEYFVCAWFSRVRNRVERKLSGAVKADCLYGCAGHFGWCVDEWEIVLRGREAASTAPATAPSGKLRGRADMK